MSTIIGTRKTELIIDSVNYTDEISSCVLSSDDTDSDFVSFAMALAGGERDYTLKLKVRQDTATAALWYYIWDAAGDDVTFEFWPNGGSPTPSATTPRVAGTLTITEPKGNLLGGEANASAVKVNTVEVEWKCLTKPVLTAA